MKKFWHKYESHTCNQLLLKGGQGCILSVEKTKQGIIFTENCDENYTETYTKKDALKLIEELKDWINKE